MLTGKRIEAPGCIGRRADPHEQDFAPGPPAHATTCAQRAGHDINADVPCPDGAKRLDTGGEYRGTIRAPVDLTRGLTTEPAAAGGAPPDTDGRDYPHEHGQQCWEQQVRVASGPEHLVPDQIGDCNEDDQGNPLYG